MNTVYSEAWLTADTHITMVTQFTQKPDLWHTHYHGNTIYSEAWPLTQTLPCAYVLMISFGIKYDCKTLITAGYCFTKAFMQNLNLRTDLKRE